LKEDDPRAIEAMMGFMYRFDYDGSGSHLDRVSPMLFHVKVYAIADKYRVLALKEQAKKKFENTVETCWNMDDFPHVVSEVYATSHAKDRNLRDTVVNVSHKHIAELLKKQPFSHVLENTPGFAADITRRLAEGQKPKEQDKYRCPNCGITWEAKIQDGSYGHCINCGNHRSNWDSYKV
jgi:speckle-type POZ protein